MGVYRWYLIFPLIVYSALSYSATRSQIINAAPPSFLMYRSSNIVKLTDDQCQARPVLNSYQMTGIFHAGDSTYALYKGCIYEGFGHPMICPDNSDYCIADWKPLYAYVEPDGGDDDSGGDTGDSDGDSTPPTEPDNPGVTPPVKPPVKPNPDTSSVAQLRDQYLQCSNELSKMPLPNYSDYNPAVDYQYNALARQCNSVYDSLSSLVISGSVNAGSDDNHNFITGDGSGGLYSCKRNPYTPQEWADMGKFYPGPVLGHQLLKQNEREIGFNCHLVDYDKDGKYENKCTWHLNPNYVVDNGKGTSVCNSVYSSHSGTGDSDGGSQGGGDSQGDGDGSGQGNTDTGDDTHSGDDTGPGISLPSLDVPDLTLAPLWNIWPSARDFKLTLPAAQCPVFNIEVFGTTHQIDTFCTIFTPDIIAIIRAICILTASVFSFIIVLRS